jgi:hypothetical protein
MVGFSWKEPKQTFMDMRKAGLPGSSVDFRVPGSGTSRHFALPKE